MEKTEKKGRRRTIMHDEEGEIPFAWRHIVLVDRKSNAGRVITKIKQESEIKTKMPEKRT